MNKISLKFLAIILMFSNIQIRQIKADDTGAIVGGTIATLLVTAVASAIVYFKKNPGKWDAFKEFLKDKQDKVASEIDQQPQIPESQKIQARTISDTAFEKLQDSVSKKSPTLVQDSVRATAVAFGGDTVQAAGNLLQSKPLQGADVTVRSNVAIASGNVAKLQEMGIKAETIQKGAIQLSIDAAKQAGTTKANADTWFGSPSDAKIINRQISELQTLSNDPKLTPSDKAEVQKEISTLQEKINAPKTASSKQTSSDTASFGQVEPQPLSTLITKPSASSTQTRTETTTSSTPLEKISLKSRGVQSLALNRFNGDLTKAFDMSVKMGTINNDPYTQQHVKYELGIGEHPSTMPSLIKPNNWSSSAEYSHATYEPLI